MTASLVTRPYDVRMRVPVQFNGVTIGDQIRTLRVNAVNPGSAIAEAAMELDRLGVRDCELVDVVEVQA